MKKGIKYAGIAAATLLTVAPVVAPVVGSTTQTVQAAESYDDLTKDQKSILSTLSGYYENSISLEKSKFAALNLMGTDVAEGDTIKDSDGKDKTAAAEDVTTSLKTVYQKKDITYSQLAKTNAFDALRKETNSGLLGSKINKLNDVSKENDPAGTSAVKFYVEGITASGDTQPDKNAASFEKLVNEATKNGGSVSIKITAYKAKDVAETKAAPAEDSNNMSHAQLKEQNILGSKTITIDNTNKDAEIKAPKVEFSFTNPLKVKVGSKVVDTQISESVDPKLTLNGKELKSSASVDDVLYKSEKGAAKADANDKTDISKFNDNGAKYYQKVTFKVTNQNDIVDGNGATKTLTDINNNHYAGYDDVLTVNGANVNTQQVTADTVTVVRTIQVADPATDWTVEDITGQVHVGDKKIDMVTTDGKDAGRGLAAHTDWITDKKRTNGNGDVQYRVSKEEWVNANDVKFTADSATTNPSDGALTDIQDLQGRHVVSLDGPAGFVYSLFTAEGKRASRGLAGLTSWATDKTAKDAEGTVYYRVSTNEWLKAGNGVNFK